MKYSIILPYYNRPELRLAMQSFVKYYSGRLDYEVVVVEDQKNRDNAAFHGELVDIIEAFSDKFHIVLICDPSRSCCPAGRFNMGVKESSGEYVVLSNPETTHTTDVLSGLDHSFALEDGYILCACMNVKSGKFDRWYHHSQYNNTGFHFCSALSKESYISIGGFDERYCQGIGYEDLNFINRIKRSNIPIIYRDDLIVEHIDHEKTYMNDAMVNINKAIYEGQLKGNCL